MTKNSNLMAALGKPAGSTIEMIPTSSAQERPKKTRAGRSERVGSSRDGKEPMTNWLNPTFSDTLEELKLKRKRAGEKISREGLVAEALNLLFEKHNLPTVRE